MHPHRLIYFPVAIAAMLITVYSCVQPEPLTDNDHTEWLSGGSQTTYDKGSGAFSHPFPNLLPHRASVHETGDAAFGATFVSAPAPVRPGLGPIFNNVSCTSCHISDGRGKPPLAGEQITSLLIRLSLPGQNEHGGPVPVPGFGGQLQQRSIFGTQPEASVRINYTEKAYSFNDGVSYSLRFPEYFLDNPYAPLPAHVLISPERVRLLRDSGSRLSGALQPAGAGRDRLSARDP